MKTTNRLEVIAYTMFAQLPMKFSYADKVFGLVGEGESLAEALAQIYMSQTKAGVSQSEIDELEQVISEAAEGETKLPTVVDREAYLETYHLLLDFMAKRCRTARPPHVEVHVDEPRDDSEKIIYNFANGTSLPTCLAFLRSQSEPFDFGD